MQMKDIPLLSDAELEEYLAKAEYGWQGRNYAMEEYTRRQLAKISKPHWSVAPNFWFSLIAAVAAVTALAVQVVEWRRPAPIEEFAPVAEPALPKSSSSQLEPSAEAPQ